jgi:hypothetical protein
MRQKIEYEAAKTDNIASQRTSEELYREALAAFRVYNGVAEEDDDEED